MQGNILSAVGRPVICDVFAPMQQSCFYSLMSVKALAVIGCRICTTFIGNFEVNFVPDGATADQGKIMCFRFLHSEIC
jgi:hypothetical protein